MLGLHCESVLVKTLQQLFLLRNLKIWLNNIKKISGKLICCINLFIIIMIIFFMNTVSTLAETSLWKNWRMRSRTVNCVRWRWTTCLSHGRQRFKNKFLPNGTTGNTTPTSRVMFVINVVNFIYLLQLSLHSGVREFTCDKCEKSFATRDILRRHKIIHEQKRTYECHKCHKKFDRKVCFVYFF